MSSSIVDLLQDLATDPALYRAYRQSPERVLAGIGLTEAELAAVMSGDVSAVDAVVGPHTAAEPVDERYGTVYNFTLMELFVTAPSVESLA